MIVVKHVDSIFGSLVPIRLSTFKLVLDNRKIIFYIINISISDWSRGEYPAGVDGVLCD